MKLLSLSARAFVCTLLFSAGLSACKSTEKLTTQAPANQAPASKTYQRKLSSINVPVSLPVKSLEDRLNAEVKGVLYKDDDLEPDNVALRVTKNGNISLKAENDKLYFAIPLDIYAKGRWQWQACDICPKLSKTEDTRFGLTMKFETSLSLTEDYAIKSSTISDFEWGNHPEISLGPLKISLARFVEPAMKSQMQNLSTQIDRELSSRINIKEQLRTYWVQLQQPVLLDKGLDAWLKITPQEIRVSPLQARAGELNLKIGIKSYLETLTNGKPAVQINKTLPRLITDKNLPEDIQIGLTAEVGYEQASRLLKEQLKGKSFTFENGKQQVTINDLDLQPSADKLQLMLDVNGKAKAGLITKKITGKVYLKAIPYYHVESGSIRIRDAEYTLETRDVLLRSASWLTKGTLQNLLEQQVSFPVIAQLDEGRKALQQLLDKQGRLNEYVSLKGTITDLVPDDIYLSPASIKAVVNAKGNLRVRVEKL